MGYTESLLASGERVVRSAHQHWFILIWRARWAVFGLLIALVMTILRLINKDTSGFLWTILGWASLILVAFGILNLVWGALTYRAEEYVISSRRLIHVQGVINKKASDSSLEKINDAILVESIFGRIFGFGNLEVLTASESGIEKLQMLRDAKEFKKAMLDAKHEYEIDMERAGFAPAPPIRQVASTDAPAPSAVAATVSAAGAATLDDTTAVNTELSPDEVTRTLNNLADLRDRGAITADEYEAKKADLLDRL